MYTFRLQNDYRLKFEKQITMIDGQKDLECALMILFSNMSSNLTLTILYNLHNSHVILRRGTLQIQPIKSILTT